MTVYESVIKALAPHYQAWSNPDPREIIGYEDTYYYRGMLAGMRDTLALIFDKDFWDVEQDLENAENE